MQEKNIVQESNIVVLDKNVGLDDKMDLENGVAWHKNRTTTLFSEEDVAVFQGRIFPTTIY